MKKSMCGSHFRDDSLTQINREDILRNRLFSESGNALLVFRYVESAYIERPVDFKRQPRWFVFRL
jgi:hypothetical protein